MTGAPFIGMYPFQWLALVTAALALPLAGEVLVSSAVKDLVSGSGIEFGDGGSLTSEEHGAWRLFSVK
ncbi:MAG: hypothetical protein M3348_03265 [Acidobacteriota bacterium]|nr:hypothetical protein [Acidobacteriota bacterium]